MRHYFSPCPVAAHPGGMGTPPERACLVAPASILLRTAARLCSTAMAAVDLPPVATAADDHLATAAGTQEQTPQRQLGLPIGADETWTNAMIRRIVALHSCPARCGARRRCRTSRLSSAPCLPSSLAGSWHAAEVSQASFAPAGLASTALGPDPIPRRPHAVTPRLPWAHSGRGYRPSRRQPTAGNPARSPPDSSGFRSPATVDACRAPARGTA